MRCRLWMGAGAAVLLGMTFAQPASAHQGHSRCAEGAHATVVVLAHAGEAGETASGLARAGTINENVAQAHAALCEPRPQP